MSARARKQYGIVPRPAGFLSSPCLLALLLGSPRSPPRLVTLSNSISFSHASQRVYILTKEHCSSWLNINIVPEAENGPRLAGFSGVLSPPPLCVCRRPLPPVNTNGCRHKSRIFARCCIVKSFHGMRSRWRSFLIPLFSHDDE